MHSCSSLAYFLSRKHCCKMPSWILTLLLALLLTFCIFASFPSKLQAFVQFAYFFLICKHSWNLLATLLLCCLLTCFILPFSSFLTFLVENLLGTCWIAFLHSCLLSCFCLLACLLPYVQTFLQFASFISCTLMCFLSLISPGCFVARLLASIVTLSLPTFLLLACCFAVCLLAVLLFCKIYSLLYRFLVCLFACLSIRFCLLSFLLACLQAFLQFVCLLYSYITVTRKYSCNFLFPFVAFL